jgi:esterase
MVVLHGLFGAARNWSGLARRLGETLEVHALDLRNHGDSPWDDRMDYPAMAADVLAYMDAQGLERPILVGHSMGGKAAMCLALSHPERIGPLVVADIAPVSYDNGREAFIAAMRAVPLSGLARRAEAEAHLREAVPDPGIRMFLMQNLVEDPAGGYRWRLNLPVLDRCMDQISGFPDLAGPFDGPCLFIRGDRSDYIQDGHRSAITARFPRARVATLKDAGHWLHSEQPEAFLATLRAFLSRVP